MSTLKELKEIACKAIDDHKDELHKASDSIWKNPELNFEEHHAHDVLCTLLEKHGLNVERHYKLDTAFQAVYGSSDEGEPCIMVISEYDALPEIGHACGHNLIAEVGVGAGIGIKTAMEAAGKKLGKLIVLGTPGEEGGGGKIDLINEGAFKQASLAMMSHPWKGKTQVPIPGFLASLKMGVTYKGRASHAAAAPWMGINALDAVVLAYTNISCLRQQLKPAYRVQGIITNGGAKPNIIPEEASASFIARAPSQGELKILVNKVTACLEAAATATGCEVTINMPKKVYGNVLTNHTIASLYQDNALQLGIELCTDPEEIGKASASTDMGNVSHVVPSIHPLYDIESEGFNHTRQFTKAAGSLAAQLPTLQQAKTLAMTALDVLWNPDLLFKIREHFEEDLRKDANTERLGIEVK